jgi:hypothetical protein
MLTREEAQQLLLERLKIRADGLDQFISEDRIVERSFGWLFFVAITTSKTAAQAGALPYHLIIVNKHSNQIIGSSIEYTPERFIDIYENLLAKNQAQGQNWCLSMSLPFPWKRSGRERLATKAKDMGLYELK